MRRKVLLLVFVSLIFAASVAYGELDLDRDVIQIPDTHDVKSYLWDVRVNPRGYSLLMEEDDFPAGQINEIRFRIASESDKPETDIHVFVTDEDLNTFEHIRPIFDAGIYRFPFNPSLPGKYRMEIVFKTNKGWIDLRKNIKVNGKVQQEAKTPDDSEYAVRFKVIPRKVYTNHVATIIYELYFRGSPLNKIEKMDGVDLQAVSWDEDLKEFIYTIPRQNAIGHKAALSFVFKRTGKHIVFAEFKHGGKIRKVDLSIDVDDEPEANRGIDVFK